MLCTRKLKMRSQTFNGITARAVDKLISRANMNLHPGQAYKIIHNIEQIDAIDGMEVTTEQHAWFVIQNVDRVDVGYVVVNKAGKVIDGPFATPRATFYKVLDKFTKFDPAFHTEGLY